MSMIISRDARPELFSDDEKSITEIVNAVEAVYAEISTKPEGYNQQELLKAAREAGISSYESNIAISILFETKKIISIIS